MSGGFTLRQLEALMAVAECNGYAAAARSLGVSQPAVSKHIRALERRLGYALFNMAPGAAPRLTTRGKRMVDALPNLLAEIRSVSSRPDALAGRRQVVRIGCGDALAERIADCIPEIYAKLGDVAIELRLFDPSVSSALKLQEDDIDLAYLTLRAPPSDRIAERIATATSGVYLPTRLTNGRSWSEDESLPIISAADNSFLSRDFDLALRLCGIRAFHVVARVITQRDRIKLALAGIGAVLSMDAAVRHYVASGQLRRIGSGGLTLHRCRFVNPARFGDRRVRQVERILTDALSHD
ncbi:MAG: LysR family transcriptional regulator [Steroidobacteraceae bacterium]